MITSSLGAGVGRVHLHGAPRLEGAEIEGGGPRRHLELEKIRLLVRDTDLGVRPRTDEGAGPDLQFQASPLSCRRAAAALAARYARRRGLAALRHEGLEVAPLVELAALDHRGVAKHIAECLAQPLASVAYAH